MTSRPPCTGAALLRPSPALLRPYGAAIPPPVRAQRCCAPTAPRGCAPTCAAIPPPVRAQRCCAPRPRCAPLARAAAPLARAAAPLRRRHPAPCTGAALLRPSPARLRPYGAAIPPPCMGAALLRPYVRPYGAGPNNARRSGSAKTCTGGADAITRPSCITTTVSAHCRATVRSWVASSTVTPCSTSRSKIAKI